jgi:hypothetical protein
MQGRKPAFVKENRDVKGALILMLGTAAASALMTLVLIVLFFVWLVRLFSSRTPLQRKAHDLLVLAIYALFPVQVVTNLLAVAGTLGDGNTSMFRSIELSTLIAVPSIQLAAFALWLTLRFTLFRTPGQSSGSVVAIPGVIPLFYLIAFGIIWYPGY